MKATSTRRFAALGAMAMAMAAALVALAIAMPGNASAYTFESDTYYIGDGEIVELNQHDPSKSLYVFVDGNATIKGDVKANGRLEIMPMTNSNNTHLTINGDVSGGTVIFDGYFDPAQFKVTVNGTFQSIYAVNTLTIKTAILTVKGPYGINSDGDMEVSNATVKSSVTKSANYHQGIFCGGNLTVKNGTVTATGYDYGIVAGGLSATNATVSGTATRKSTGSTGIESTNGIGAESSTITGTGYDRGIDTETIQMIDTTITGKASKPKTSTLASGKYAYGIKCATISSQVSTINGYAYAASKSLSKTNPQSVGIKADTLYAYDTDVYGSNTGKYGVGVFTKDMLGILNQGYKRGTLKAYGKNAGIGLLCKSSNEGRFIIYDSDAIIYGGKYGIYADGVSTETSLCKLKVYGKNASGTRTGHGIYAKNAYINFTNGSEVTVYAKKSSSYYGIYSTYSVPSSETALPPLVSQSSKLNIYAYSSKAYKYKLPGKSAKKGYVVNGTIKVNGKTQKSYPSIGLD